MKNLSQAKPNARSESGLTSILFVKTSRAAKTVDMKAGAASLGWLVLVLGFSSVTGSLAASSFFGLSSFSWFSVLY